MAHRTVTRDKTHAGSRPQVGRTLRVTRAAEIAPATLRPVTALLVPEDLAQELLALEDLAQARPVPELLEQELDLPLAVASSRTKRPITRPSRPASTTAATTPFLARSPRVPSRRSRRRSRFRRPRSATPSRRSISTPIPHRASTYPPVKVFGCRRSSHRPASHRVAPPRN